MYVIIMKCTVKSNISSTTYGLLLLKNSLPCIYSLLCSDIHIDSCVLIFASNQARLFFQLNFNFCTLQRFLSALYNHWHNVARCYIMNGTTYMKTIIVNFLNSVFCLYSYEC